MPVACKRDVYLSSHCICKLFQTDNFVKHLKIKTASCFDIHVNIWPFKWYYQAVNFWFIAVEFNACMLEEVLKNFFLVAFSCWAFRTAGLRQGKAVRHKRIFSCIVFPEHTSSIELKVAVRLCCGIDACGLRVIKAKCSQLHIKLFY